MANNKPNQKQPSKSSSSSAASATAEVSPLSAGIFAAGVVLLLGAIFSSGWLVFSHISGLAMPGCGVGSGCDLATKSKWGTVPGINWPVSFLGFSFFFALLIAWLGSRGGVSSALRWLVRLGALASLFFIGVMIFGDFLCKWCTATHVANLLFWVMLEFSAARSPRSLSALARFAAVFAFVTLGVGIVQMTSAKKVQKERDADFAESIKEITQKPVRETPRTATTVPSMPLADAGERYSPDGGFTSRWRQGPENAPIRIVIISDYQCKDCKAMEMQVRALLTRRQDVSVAAKHYPFCKDCNDYIGMLNMHPNACWAARAAEAAGIMRGNDGFWAMHRWLFDKEGAFTDAEFDIGLASLGYSQEERIQLQQIMKSEETLKTVKSDVDEATKLGMHFTPMVFINGVELRGFIGRNTALREAVERVAASNPQPASPGQDQPQLAVDKALEDWRVLPVYRFPDSPKALPIGPANARVEIVVWSDSQYRTINEVEEIIKQAMKDRGDVRYIFRSFPQDKNCNPYTIVARPSVGCWVAKAHEAAGMLNGADGYWKVHDWILANQDKLSALLRDTAPTEGILSEALVAKLNEMIAEAAPSLGLDPDALVAKINSPEAAEALRLQVEASTQFVQGALKKRGQIPSIFVNGKHVPRWKLQQTPVLRQIIDEAGKK